MSSNEVKASKKRTPSYDHVLRDKTFRQHVYEPEADSFLLLDAIDADRDALIAASRSRDGPLVALEMGPGSGIVITHLAMSIGMPTADGSPPSSDHGVSCLAIDINPRALQATRITFDSSVPVEVQRSGRATLDLIRGDLMMPLSIRAKFDVLIFNPPYVPTSVEELNVAVRNAATDSDWLCAAWAGGPAGRLVVDRLLPVLHLLLRPGVGVAYIIALAENNAADMIRIVEAASHGALTGHPVVTRWTGEQLSVLKFAFRSAVVPTD